jgi:hypothetical protein
MNRSILLKLTKKRKKRLQSSPLFLLLFLLLFFGCSKAVYKIQPKMECPIQDRALTSRPSAFPPLSLIEEKEDWGKEYRIAKQFFLDLDLYRAISTLKRAEILLSSYNTARKEQIQYEILYCYYLGKKSSDFIEEFEKSSLCSATPSFPAYRELLIMLYDSYRILHKEIEKEHILHLIQLHYPELAEKLLSSRAFLEGDLDYIKKKPEFGPFLSCYDRERKSPQKAQTLNALFPGAGYYYLGLKRTALTALLMNGLFIAGSYEFFHHGYTAVGIITLSFEAGWYFGGIYGAGEEAKFYNERVFERNATPFMRQEKLFPLLQLNYGF